MELTAQEAVRLIEEAYNDGLTAQCDPLIIDELRSKALCLVLSLCKGRSDEYTDAFDTDIIVEQMEFFVLFLRGPGFASEEERALRAKMLDIAISLCEGRSEEYTDAYDADVIVEQAENLLTALTNDR